MELLVVGCGGLVGSNVVLEARDRNWSVTGTFHSTSPDLEISTVELDIRDREATERVISRNNPDAVINCAAMTDVDACETRFQDAVDTNGAAPGELADICGSAGIDLVHLSTDYVFSGRNRPYRETDKPRPIQRYGATKLLGEYRVRSEHPSPIVARLSFVYGVHGSTGTVTGFPSWVRDRLATKEVTGLFTDQFVTPTRARTAAEVLCDLLTHGEHGLFHVSSRSCITPYEFGQNLCDIWNYDADLLKKILLTDIDRTATRPEYSCLNVDKVATALDYALPTLEEDLAALNCRDD
jgi:dTDP-4-dehydrorhamnose reductase